LKKGLKYTLAFALLFFIAYHSVYFKKLDAYKAGATKTFDPVKYAKNYFDQKLLPNLDKAIELNQLTAELQKDKEKTFDRYSHALGIGNIRFFMVKGQGVVSAIGPNDVTLETKTDTTTRSLTIATEFVFGNAIRDASGMIDINEFENTMDFNNVSAEVNKIVRNQVLPPFKKTVKHGDVVQFTGAIELNREHLNLENIEVVPVSLYIVQGHVVKK
jgi:predicted lipoprotein